MRVLLVHSLQLHARLGNRVINIILLNSRPVVVVVVYHVTIVAIGLWY